MRHHSEVFEERPFLKIRRGYLDILAAGRRRHLIHGLVEVDVTDARRLLHTRPGQERLSFTAFLIACVAKAVSADRGVHAYRRGSRLILFDDVDVNTQIEAELDGQKVVQSLVIRAANRKSIGEMTRETRATQTGGAGSAAGYRAASWTATPHLSISSVSCHRPRTGRRDTGA